MSPLGGLTSISGIQVSDLSPSLGHWYRLYENPEKFKQEIIVKAYQNLTPFELQKLIQFLNHNHMLHQALDVQDEPYALALIQIGCDLFLEDDKGRIPIVIPITQGICDAMRARLQIDSKDLKSLYEYYLNNKHANSICSIEQNRQIFLDLLAIDPMLLVQLIGKQTPRQTAIIRILYDQKTAEQVFAQVLPYFYANPFGFIEAIKKMAIIAHPKHLLTFLNMLYARSDLPDDFSVAVLLSEEVSNQFHLDSAAFFAFLATIPIIKKTLSDHHEDPAIALSLYQMLQQTDPRVVLKHLLNSSPFHEQPQKNQKRILQHLRQVGVTAHSAYKYHLQSCGERLSLDTFIALEFISLTPLSVPPEELMRLACKFNWSFAEVEKVLKLDISKLAHKSGVCPLSLIYRCGPEDIDPSSSEYLPNILFLLSNAKKIPSGLPLAKEATLAAPHDLLIQFLLVVLSRQSTGHILSALKNKEPTIIQALFIACCQNPRAFAKILRAIIKSKQLDSQLLYTLSRSVATLSTETAETRLFLNTLITHRIFPDLGFTADGKTTQKIQSIFENNEPYASLVPFWQRTIKAGQAIVLPEHPRAEFVLNALKGQSFTEMQIPLKIAIQLLRTREEALQFGNYLFDNPAFFSKCIRPYFKAKHLGFSSSSFYSNTFGKYIAKLFSVIGDLTHIPKTVADIPVWAKELVQAKQQSSLPNCLLTCDLLSEGTWRTQGRTIVVKSAADDGNFYALKFLKRGESLHTLGQEFPVTATARRYSAESRFKSRFATPIALASVTVVSEALRHKIAQANAIEDFAYVYRAPAEYFMYPQELSDKENSNRFDMAHDTIKWVKNGLYPDIVSIFHNKFLNRVYTILVTVMESLSTGKSGDGAGRLEKIFPSVAHPNIRNNFLADLHDFSSLFLCVKGDKDRDHWKDPTSTASGRFFYQFKGFVNVWFSDAIIQLDRLRRHEPLDWTNEKQVAAFASLLKESYAKKGAFYGQIPEKQSLDFAEKCGIDWECAAREMIFFSDPSKTGYPAWLARGELPESLQRAETSYNFDLTSTPNFDAKNGFTTQGELDMGPFNGPLLLVELELAACLMFFYMVKLESAVACEQSNCLLTPPQNVFCFTALSKELEKGFH